MNTALMLAAKDLVQQRKRILFNLMIMAGISLMTITGGAGAGVVASVLPMLTLVTTMGILYEEERNRGLQFLRSLPLPPGTVVAGKFLAIVAYLAIYAATGAALLALAGRLGDLTWVHLLVSGGAALLLGGAAGVAFYWFGYQAISWFFAGGLLLVTVLTVLPALMGGLGSGRVASMVASTLAWVTGNPARGGSLGLMAIVPAYLLLAWAATRGLARREL